MNSSLQKALSHLTEHENIDAVSVKFLENLVHKYPYFPIAHILLSKKLKAEGSENYLQQVQKTALYFDKPYWLYYQLSPGIPEPVFDGTIENKQSETLPGIQTEDDVQIIPDQFHPEPEIVQEEIESGEPFFKDPKPKKDNIPAMGVGAVDAQVPKTWREDEISNSEPIVNIPVNEKDIALGTAPEAVLYDAETPGKESGEKNLSDETINSPEDESSIEVPKPISISEEELEEDERLIHEIAHPGSTTNPQENSQVTHSPDNNAVDIKLEDKVIHALKGHHAFSKEMEERTHALIHPHTATHSAGEGSISYEPYHTIDYFASQGIQLILENNPQDKLGKQLKKFTQWLKHMKRLGPEDALNAVRDSHLEDAIQGIADSSNTPRDVVTETMASVLEKQGKTEKAIELYTKLTFLNPDKSAYFADKIQKLKEN